MKIELLADNPQFISTIAAWLYAEWGWFMPPGSSVETVADKVHAHANRSALPLAMVARDGAELLGTASLRIHDMDILTELSPWLGGVYIDARHRNKGIGGRLVKAIEAQASALSYNQIYLFTFNQSPFYLKRGWQVLRNLGYRGHAVTVMNKSLA